MTRPEALQCREPREAGDLAVRDWDGEAPALVMLHGFPDNVHIFDLQAPELAQAGRSHSPARARSGAHTSRSVMAWAITHQDTFDAVTGHH
jgi:hypothetical protein